MSTTKPLMRGNRAASPKARLCFSAAATTEHQLELLKLRYQEKLGRNVSRSLIIRRAISGLLDHAQQSLNTKQQVQDELAALTMNAEWR